MSSECATIDQRDLDNYILCPKCDTLHRKIPLQPGAQAKCTNCGMVLYRYDPAYLSRALALSVTGLIFFVAANLFPLIKIDKMGMAQHVNILEAISQLLNEGYYVIAVGVMFMVFIIPLMVVLNYIAVIVMLKLGLRQELTRDLLVLLARLIPWSMMDIFFISILVALVKLAGEVQIHFGASFWALMLFVIIDTYLTKAKRMGYLWAIYNRRYR